jgi:hypothetical protein
MKSAFHSGKARAPRPLERIRLSKRMVIASPDFDG